MEHSASVVVIAVKTDDSLKELSHLPAGAEVTFVGSTKEDFSTPEAEEQLANCSILLNCIGTKDLLSHLWPRLPKLKWIHSRFAGVDHVLFPELVESDVVLSNAQGLFSGSLAEYVLFACMYFAKDADRWKRQQREKRWEKFVIQEVKGQTVGVLGYGNIGQAAAKACKALGMKVIAMRRNAVEEGDGVAERIYGSGAESVAEICSKSDYVVLAAALTADTMHMVGEKELKAMQPHGVLINVGRGKLVDQNALINALRNCDIRGAGLDVFETEPLPADSPLWEMENVLLSPHNADMTATFLHDSVRLFAKTGVANFIAGRPLEIHEVDKKLGY